MWSGGHALARTHVRGVPIQEAESIVRESAEQEPSHHGRWIVWGCVGGRRTKIVVKPLRGDVCLVVTVVRTGKPCS